MSLSPERITALKTALYRDAHNASPTYVAPGFQVYAKGADGVIRPVTSVGTPCREMISTYQKNHKLPVTGEFDTATQDKLIPPPKETPGDKIAAKAHELLKLAPLNYTQARPCATTAAALKSHGGDCSCLAMLCLGAVLPEYLTGYGNTWSLVVKGTHVTFGSHKPGDLVFYGPRAGDPTHVAVYVGQGFVVSLGSQNGPFLEAIDYRGDRIDIRRYA